MINKNKLIQIEGLYKQLIELDNIKQPFVVVDVSTGDTTIIRRYCSEVKELAESEESYIKEQIRKLSVGDLPNNMSDNCRTWEHIKQEFNL